MGDKLKDFLEQNKELINNNKFDEFFSNTMILAPNKYYKIIDAFHEANIDILPYVTEIPSHYFEMQEDIQTFTVPENINKLKYKSFAECYNLIEISLPSSLILIYNSCFDGCKKLKNIKFNGTRKQWERIDIFFKGNAPLFKADIQCIDGQIKYYYDNLKGWSILEN